MASRQHVVADRVCVRAEKSLGHTMIRIYRCQLVDGEWQCVERLHTTRGFALMSEAVEFAESLNEKTWPRFDWLLEPVEAFLAMRSKDRVSPCEDDVDGASEEK
jgi:hypothetical protein